MKQMLLFLSVLYDTV